jgi:hypothetical protein
VLDPEATAAIRELREKANRKAAPIPVDAPFEPEMWKSHSAQMH